MSKVLLYDIETTPLLAYVWNRYDEGVIKVVKESELLCVAYKWLGEDRVQCISRKGKADDRNVVEALHKLFSQAQQIVAHNGDRFDFKKTTARMAFYNLPPIHKIPSVDTLKLARSRFSFSSNKLDDLGLYLGLGRKHKHSGFELWERCMADEPKAWVEMIKYNIKDVELLERVYRHFEPWIPKKKIRVRKSSFLIGKSLNWSK